MVLNTTLSRRITLTFSELTVTLIPAGEGIHVLVLGGERPHIGCVVLAVPRESLSGDGSVSCTSSVLNVTGHKDEAIVRLIAEKVCAAYGCVVSASGGFHLDGMTAGQILEIEKACAELDFSKGS